MFEVYEPYIYDDDKFICYVETEEEAERICKVANALGKDYQYAALHAETADEIITGMLEEHEEELAKRIATLKERVERSKADIDMLKACKKFLDPYLIGVDDFIPLIPEMYEAVLKTELPITFYANHKNYTREGIEESYGERLVYAPIYIKSFFYKNGNYDINNDIMMLESSIIRYNEELNDLLNGKEK